jgi:hypothetical protein
MDAPVYLPSDHFVAPVRTPRILTTGDTSIADLLAIPAARAIVEKDLPGAGMLLGSPMLKPHLGNFSFRSLVQFGAFKGDALDKVDLELRALGPMA